MVEYPAGNVHVIMVGLCDDTHAYFMAIPAPDEDSAHLLALAEYESRCAPNPRIGCRAKTLLAHTTAEFAHGILDELAKKEEGFQRV